MVYLVLEGAGQDALRLDPDRRTGNVLAGDGDGGGPLDFDADLGYGEAAFDVLLDLIRAFLYFGVHDHVFLVLVSNDEDAL